MLPYCAGKDPSRMPDYFRDEGCAERITLLTGNNPAMENVCTHVCGNKNEAYAIVHRNDRETASLLILFIKNEVKQSDFT